MQTPAFRRLRNQHINRPPDSSIIKIEGRVMAKPVVDVKRTCPAVQATPGDRILQPGYFKYGRPGKARSYSTNYFMFCCPGCGQAGGITAGHPKPDNSNGASWDILAGSLDDVTTLTLSPSIHCVGCCQWHGHLQGGVFKSC